MPFSIAVAARPRAFVKAAGPDAEEYIQRMVSNDVAALKPGDACDALLLTPKARVIAPLRLLRRGPGDFLLVTEPELGETVRAHLLKSRFAAKVSLELEEHESYLLLGPEASPPPGVLAIPTSDYGVPGFEIVGESEPTEAARLGDANVIRLDDARLEELRIRAGTPRFGREIDDRVLPAEVGLVERAVSLTKGCYPGQEPIARLHYRGHVNRTLRVLEIEGEELPELDAEIVHGGRSVGRVTSAARAQHAVIALGFVRVEVPEDASLRVGAAAARVVAARA